MFNLTNFCLCYEKNISFNYFVIYNIPSNNKQQYIIKITLLFCCFCCYISITITIIIFIWKNLENTHFPNFFIRFFIDKIKIIIYSLIKKYYHKKNFIFGKFVYLFLLYKIVNSNLEYFYINLFFVSFLIISSILI